MIELYTDGACSGNPGKGGWAFAVVKNGNLIHSAAESLIQTTNNECELLAICNGLFYVTYFLKTNDITVYSDSAYCVNGYNEWIHNWRKNGFLTAKKEPVKNRDHWNELLNYVDIPSIKVIKIKGHSGNKFNSLVDRMAVDSYLKLP